MPLKTHLDEQPTLNLTPMIDIVFLLIIFFMVGTKFSERERNIPLQLPEVYDRGTLTAAPAQRIINVYRDSRITLDRTEVSLKELTEQLAAARSQYPELDVLIRGDARVEHQHVVAVLNACKQVGIQNLGVSVQIVSQEQ